MFVVFLRISYELKKCLKNKTQYSKNIGSCKSQIKIVHT